MSCFCCLDRRWQNKRTKVPIVRRHNQLNHLKLLNKKCLSWLYSYLGGRRASCKYLSLREVWCLSWQIHKPCHCSQRLLSSPWSNMKDIKDYTIAGEILRTLSFLCCLHHMWQSRKSMIPTARHRSQLLEKILLSNSKYHVTRRAHSQIACVSFCERNRPLRCTFCSIVNSACIFNPEQWNDHRQSWKLIFMHLFLFLLPPPHVTVQELHDPHGPTSQSTGIRFVLPNFYHSLWHTRRTFNYIACFCFSKLKYWRHGRFFTFLPIVFCIHDLCPDRKILKFSRIEYEHLPFLVLFLFPSPQVIEQYVQAPHGPALQLTGL